jgi:hypothetical protein
MIMARNGPFRVAFGCGNLGDDAFQYVIDADACFGRAHNRIGCIDPDHIFNFTARIVWIGVGQVDLVEHWQNFNTEVQRRVAIRNCLCFNTLAGVHHQQCSFACRKRPTHFIREVNVPGCINQIEVVDLPVFGLVLQRCGLRFDSYPTLFLDVHRV